MEKKRESSVDCVPLVGVCAVVWPVAGRGDAEDCSGSRDNVSQEVNLLWGATRRCR